FPGPLLVAPGNLPCVGNVSESLEALQDVAVVIAFVVDANPLGVSHRGPGTGHRRRWLVAFRPPERRAAWPLAFRSLVSDRTPHPRSRRPETRPRSYARIRRCGWRRSVAPPAHELTCIRLERSVPAIQGAGGILVLPRPTGFGESLTVS